jgi:hypothetical protein
MTLTPLSIPVASAPTVRPAETATRSYGYLSAVYGLVAWWAAEGRDANSIEPARALRLQRSVPRSCRDPFTAVIRWTADPAKADKRTRSKWSCVMRYALA